MQDDSKETNLTLLLPFAFGMLIAMFHVFIAVLDAFLGGSRW